MRDAHTASCTDVEACEVALLVDDGNKRDIVCEGVDVIGGRNGNGNFVLKEGE